MEVVTLGEALVDFIRKGRRGSFAGPFPGGAPAIFADAVARLGHRCSFIGVVGTDEFGKLVTQRMRGDGVDTSHVRIVGDHTTGTAFVTYLEGGHREFTFHLRHSAASLLTPADVDPKLVSRAKLLHVTGSALAVSETSRGACMAAAGLVKARGGFVSFDPNVRPELLGSRDVRRMYAPFVVGLCDVFLSGAEEARALTGESIPAKAARKLLEMGVDVVAIKVGRKGSAVATEADVTVVPPFPVEEVDPTGAGDAYDAAFVCGMLEDVELPRAALFANAVGAMAASEMGGMGGLPTRAGVEKFMRRREGKP